MDTTAAAAEQAGPADAGGDAGGVPCIRCGYDLRGRAATAVCPECGLGVAKSLGERERLEECSPAWVKRVAVGVGILTVSMVWVVIGPGVVGAWMAPAMVSSRWARVRVPWPGPAIWTAGMVVQLAGVWLATSREPGGKGGRRGWVWLWRGCTLAGILAGAGETYWIRSGMWITYVRAYGRLSWPMGLGVGLGLGIPALSAVCAACPAVGFWHLKWLAGRIGRPKLAEYAGIVGAGLSALLMANTVIAMEQMYAGLFYERPSPAVVWAGVLAPVVAGALVYAVRRRCDLRPRGWGYVWAGLLWLAACGWGESELRAEYTRRLWTMVLVIGVPIATWVVFYLWGLFLLGRMAVKFWRAGRDAEAAWRAADAGVRE